MAKKAGKLILVLMKSLAGTGHRTAIVRPRLSEQRQAILYDPIVNQRVLYKELKKLKTLRAGGS